MSLGLKQLENSFSFLLNNRKKQCEACNNFVQPNSGALPVHLISFISLSTVTFLTNTASLWTTFMYFCIFQLAYVWNCFIFRHCSFCFVLFCFSVKIGLSDTKHLNELSSWFLNDLLGVSGYFHLGALHILENQKRIDCFSLTDWVFIFFSDI